MADTKISQLTAGTTVAGGDLLEIVQGGVNKKITYTNLTAGLGSGGTDLAWINAADYGIATANADNLSQFNAAVAAVNATGGHAALYVPPGSYAITDTIDPITESNVHVFGAGPATTIRAKVGSAVGTFWQFGTATNGGGVAHVSLADMQLVCNATGAIPVYTDNAVWLMQGGHMVVRNLDVQNVAGIVRVGSKYQDDPGNPDNSVNYIARVERYEVHAIQGTLNANLPNNASGNGVWVQNGTSGNYFAIEVEIGDKNGGNMVYFDPTPRGCDQHWFTNVHLQGGSANWFEADMTTGTLDNWVFHGCVMDGAQERTVYMHGSHGVLDVHFIDCHCSSRSGVCIELDHPGSSDWTNIQFIGGRYKFSNDRAVYIHNTGGPYSQILFSGVAFMEDRTPMISARASDDTFQTSIAHYFSVNDQLIFPTGATLPTTTPQITAGGNGYKIESWPAADRFTLKTLAGASITVDANSSVAYNVIVRLPSAFAMGNAENVRVNGCYFGAFYSHTACECLYALEDLGSSDNYCITSNVARSMNTGFANGLATSGTARIVANNVNAA